jgi:hypothetical protein
MYKHHGSAHVLVAVLLLAAMGLYKLSNLGKKLIMDVIGRDCVTVRDSIFAKNV